MKTGRGRPNIAMGHQVTVGFLQDGSALEFRWKVSVQARDVTLTLDKTEEAGLRRREKQGHSIHSC
jgi:hypothetical protein